MRAATVVQVLQDLFYVLLHVLFYLWSLLKSPLVVETCPDTRPCRTFTRHTRRLQVSNKIHASTPVTSRAHSALKSSRSWSCRKSRTTASLNLAQMRNVCVNFMHRTSTLGGITTSLMNQPTNQQTLLITIPPGGVVSKYIWRSPGKM